MNIFNIIRDDLDVAIRTLIDAGDLPADLDTSRAQVEPPRDAAHGDMATNAAMVLAKPAGMKPRDLAEKLAPALAALDRIDSAEVAGPGFINLRLRKSVWLDQVKTILDAGTGYGDSKIGAGQKVNVEYVSANPTGPLHIGHARGTVVGDALASLLLKAGFDVTKEYYINDAGAQVDKLGRSAYLRYREANGETIGEIPEGLYPGEYLKDVGTALKEAHGTALMDQAEEAWLPIARKTAIDMMMASVREDLAALGVHQDVFSSERALVDAGLVEEMFQAMEKQGLIYVGVLEPPKGKKPEDWEPRPQSLFKASEYGDDIDRPLKKSDGSWTYFANDIAYHYDKYKRGFSQQIDILGADHGGYVKRMKAAVTAVSGGKADLDIKLCQMVSLKDKGEPLKMSKRAGSFVTLRDLVDAVGKDVVRFFLLTRKNDAQMDFDLTEVTTQSRDNPVFYVHYAHARCFSVLKMAQEAFPDADLSVDALKTVDLSPLADEDELALIRQLCEWPRLIDSAAEAHEPHRIAYYLQETAAAFHGLWTKGKDNTALRFVVPGDESTTMARMALVSAVRTVIASGLAVFGVEPRDELH
ncbi:MAG: arginine--tRNA ligase [Alphaproteobacteria bacterium]